MSLSESAVEGRLKRGRNQLRLRLARQGVGFAAAVALLETMRQEAAATVVPEAIAQAITMAATQPASSSIDGLDEATQLAEQEMMKMVTTKIFSSVLATALAVGVVTTGWNVIDGAIALAQRDGAAQGAGNGTIVVAAPKAKTSVNPISTTKFARVTAAAPGGQQNPGPLKYRAIGYYNTDELTPSEVRIAQQMKRGVDLSFDDSTLAEFVEYLKHEYEIPVMVDELALEEESIEPSSETFSINVRGIRLRNALDLALKKYQLEAIMHKEVLLITTAARADEMMVTRMYQCPDSWSLSKGDLTKSILASVEPSSWKEEGGPGSITGVTRGLVVSNTPHVHDKINELFGKLESLYDPGKKTTSATSRASATPRSAGSSKRAQPARVSTPTAPSDDPFGE